MQNQKQFVNARTKRKNLKQLFRFFKNDYGPDDGSAKMEKSNKDFTDAIKSENLEKEYLEDKDIK